MQLKNYQRMMDLRLSQPRMTPLNEEEAIFSSTSQSKQVKLKKIQPFERQQLFKDYLNLEGSPSKNALIQTYQKDFGSKKLL